MSRVKVKEFPKDLENGQWVQVVTESKVHYCRIWPDKHSSLESHIHRPLSEHERSIKLTKNQLDIPAVIRPWQAKLPVAETIKLHSKSSLSKLRIMMLGMVVRQSCTIEFPDSNTAIILEIKGENNSKSQDCIIGSTTKFEILSSSNNEPFVQNATVKSNSIILNEDHTVTVLTDLLVFLLNFPKTVQKLGIEPPKGILLYGPPGVGKTSIVSKIAQMCNCSVINVDGVDILSSGRGDGESKLRDIFKRAGEQSAIQKKPVILFIDEIDSIAPDRSKNSSNISLVAQLLTLLDGLKDRGQLIVFGATNRPNDIDPALRRPGRFDRELEIKVPNENARLQILEKLCQQLELSCDVDLKAIAKSTNGYVIADLVSLIREASLTSILNSKDIINKSDFDESFKKIGHASQLRSFQIAVDDMDWSDIGGLESVKCQLQQSVEWPIIHAKKFQQLGLKSPRGVLLYGPPGCSKTSLVKVIASRRAMSFFTLSGASLYSSAVGESESLVRSLFSSARSASPSIIFLDEIDTLVGKRGFASGSTGDSVQERILSTLLNEMDGIESAKNVLVVGATNRPDMIDQALLRPGRFDKIVYVPPPDYEARFKIFEIYTKGMPLSASVDISNLATLTDYFTGADIKSLCSETSLIKLRTDPDVIEIDQHDFLVALTDFNPTISKEMLQQYDSFARQFGGAF
ncbi:P-loop containing nucleoside triphosphate hydrolase protein [Globomyces pollinis-pini]|nr:P-loop containing nucleoside triphosphate hydrolase protein [Globomyces pollinis-pini]